MKTTQKLLEKATGLSDLAMDDPNPQTAMALTQTAIANALIAIALELQKMNECGRTFDTPSTKLIANKT